MQSPPSSKRTNIQTAPPNQMTAKQTQRSLEDHQSCTGLHASSWVYSLRADSPPIGSLQTILPRSPPLAPPRNRDLPESLEPLGAFLGARSLLSFSHCLHHSAYVVTNSRGQSSSSPSCMMFSKGKHSDDPNNVTRDPDTSI